MSIQQKYKHLSQAVMLALCAAGLSVSVSAHQFDWYDGQWAHEQGNIQPDETVTFGRLENGFRWALIPNDNPKGRMSIRLAVQAGSLMEEADSLGVAHYLEHMAFNGSENFPAGSLIPFFQKHGMNFGGDTNAYTSLGQTVYEMNLATNDRAALSEGFRIMRDIADKLTISEKEVNEERGIIFSEKRSRENENVLANREWRDFLYEGTGYANNVIGTEESIGAIDSLKIRKFYEKWYVPGRMVLVVSGAADKKTIASLVDGVFGDMKKVDLPPVPEIGQADRRGVKFFVQKRPVAMTNVIIEIMHPELLVRATEAREHDRILSELVEKAVHRRLFDRIEKEPDIWTGGYFRDGRLDNYSPSILISATTAGVNWKQTLKGLQEELLRVKRFGLTESEFSQVLKEKEEELKRKVTQDSRRTNERCADEFVDAFIAGNVYTSARQDLDRFRKVVASLSLQEANKWILSGFTEENRRIKVSGNFDLTTEEVENYWKTLQSLNPSAPADIPDLNFPYLELPAEIVTPKLTETKHHAESGDWSHYRAVLPNGTVIILQPLAFEKGTVSVSYIFGDGLMGVKDVEADVPRFAMSVLGLNGLGKYSTVETARLFGGRGLSVSETVLDQFNYIGGKAQSADLESLLQAVWTQLKDPVLTPLNRDRAVKFFKQTDYFRENDVSGVLRAQKSRFFSGSLNRLKSLAPEDVEKISMEEMRNYLQKIRQRGPRLIMVSGDFDVETANRWASRLFGTIDVPDLQRKTVGLHPQFPKEGREVMTVNADHSGKSIVVSAWHADLPQIEDRYRLQARRVVANVVDERLRILLREKLGASYSPFAYYAHQAEHGGYGYLLMQVETKKDRISDVEHAINEIVKELLKEGVSGEELSRLKKPMKTAWLTGRKTNQQWEALLLTTEAMNRPYLQWDNDVGSIIDRLSVNDVNQEIQEIFAGENAVLEIRSGD